MLRQKGKNYGLLGQSVLIKKGGVALNAYHFAYLTLAILLAAFIPAMFAAEKERRFSKWYVYGVFLLPIAFVHSLILKKPEHRINIYVHDKNDPSRRGKKTYRVIPAEKKSIVISPRHIYAVFFQSSFSVHLWHCQYLRHSERLCTGLIALKLHV